MMNWKGERATEWVWERVAKSFIASLFLIKALAASHTKANYCFYVMLFWFIFPVWKTDGSFGQAAKARAMESREREPAPATEQGRQEPYFWGFFFYLIFLLLLLFRGGNGNFPCRRSLLPKNCCSPGVVERKRCPSARFWSGSAPADRDVWLPRPCHVPQAWTEGKVRPPQPGQLLGNKWILQGPKCYSCPHINTVVISTGLMSKRGGRENKNKLPVLMLQVSMRWQQGKKKKSHELPLSSTRI